MKCSAYWSYNGRVCKACGSNHRLAVHHLSYKNFGNEPMSDLMGLCHSCHIQVHKNHRKFRGDLRLVSLAYVRAKRASRMPYNR